MLGRGATGFRAMGRFFFCVCVCVWFGGSLCFFPGCCRGWRLSQRHDGSEPSIGALIFSYTIAGGGEGGGGVLMKSIVKINRKKPYADVLRPLYSLQARV